jgi:TorA maturation chaperone TorD
MIEGLKEEVSIYALLKQIFWAEPAKEIIEELQKISMMPEENDIDVGLNLLANSVRKNKSRLNEYKEDLAIEFARLFIGPNNPPAVPYASFYLSESKTVMSDVTIDIRKKYLEAGMAVQALYSIPDDHVGIELEFIYYLTQKIIDLFEQGEREEASRLFELRSGFLREHMAAWIPFFADKILECSEDDFYKGAALALKGTIGKS